MRDLKRILFEPRAADEDARRREYILNIILFGSILMFVILDGVVLYDSLYHAKPLPTMMPFREFSVFLVFFACLYALSRRGFRSLASYLLVGAYFFGNSYAVYQWGVNVPTALVGYALLIVIASILISPGFAFFATAAAAAILLPLWYVQMQGMMPTRPEQFTGGDGIAVVVLYALIALIAWLSNREIERSLARARISEKELKKERDSLEVKVEERTYELRRAQLEKMENVYRLAEFGDLASGLFHNLINMMMSLMPDARYDNEDMRMMSKNLRGFAEGIRRQLQEGSVSELFSLNDAIDSAIALLEYKARKEKTNIVFLKNGDVDYYGNAFRFHSVILNLVANAIESYGVPPSGDLPAAPRLVAISVSLSADVIEISVRDNGSGIPEGMRGKIFEPFITTKERTNGMGIGLSIVKKIVEKDLRGTIAVVTEAGKGSDFIIKFPYAKAPSPED